MVATRVLTVVASLLMEGILGAQTTPKPDVRLEPHNGQTSFEIGEPIVLDLVISNPTNAPMMVNVSDYGDNSDPITIAPSTGWIAWQGESGHDYASMKRLSSEPVRIPIRVDQTAIFRTPGHYEVRASEERVQVGSDLIHLTQMQAITTNPIGIDLATMSEKREAYLVRSIESDLTNATNDEAETD